MFHFSLLANALFLFDATNWLKATICKSANKTQIFRKRERDRAICCCIKFWWYLKHIFILNNLCYPKNNICISSGPWKDNKLRLPEYRLRQLHSKSRIINFLIGCCRGWECLSSWLLMWSGAAVYWVCSHVHFLFNILTQLTCRGRVWAGTLRLTELVVFLNSFWKPYLSEGILAIYVRWLWTTCRNQTLNVWHKRLYEKLNNI